MMTRVIGIPVAVILGVTACGGTVEDPTESPAQTVTVTATPDITQTAASVPAVLPAVPTVAPTTKRPPTKRPPAVRRTTARPAPEPEDEGAYYANCSAARAAGAAPLRRGDPGYRSGLDRDSDGVACE